MKKIITWLVVGSMLICFLSACGGTENDPQQGGGADFSVGDTGGLKLPLDDENTAITWIGLAESGNTGSTYIFEKLGQVTGTSIQVELFPVGSYKDKVQVLMASRNLPDIIGTGLDMMSIHNYANQGALESANTYIDELPNIRKLFFDNEEYGWISKIYASGDGNLYMLPNYDTSRDVNHGMLYRKDIFDRHGISMWESTEEFYQVLKKLKELYPDSVPFTSKQKENLLSYLSVSWGTKAYSPYYNEDEKVWKHSATDLNTRSMLDFLNKLYSEKLIDPEFLTLTEADWTAKMTQKDKAFTTFDWIGRLDQFTEQAKNAIPEYDLRYANPIGPKGTLVTLSKVHGIYSVASKGENSKLALQLLDFLYSPAGAQLMTMGIEDETFVLDDNDMAKYIEFEEGKLVTMNDLVAKYGMFVQGTYKRMDRRSCYFNYTEREQEAQDKGILEKRFEPLDPELSFTEDEQSRIHELDARISTEAKNAFFNYILNSGSGDAQWNDWLSRANHLGVDEVIQIYNEAQKRYNEMME